MVLRGINRTAWGTDQAAPRASLGLLCGLYQFMSYTGGTALLFESEWLPSAILSYCVQQEIFEGFNFFWKF